MDIPNHKSCTKCGIDKNYEEYSVDNKRKDGRCAKCKVCVSEYRKAKRNGTLPEPTPEVYKIEVSSKCCTKCGIEKELDEYFGDKTKKDGKMSQCKVCRKQHYQQVKNKNIENPLVIEDGTVKTCKRCLVEKPLTKFYKENTTKSGYKGICKVCSDTDKNNYKENNKEKVRLCNQRRHIRYYNSVGKYVKKAYRQRNKDIISEKSRLYREKNRLIIQEKERQNRPKTRAYVRFRRQTNIQVKLATSLRNRLGSALRAKKNKKTNSAIHLLGCTLTEVKEHIEKQFVEGMTWNNYGKWEIDHILPVASFDLRDEKQQKKCFHFTNLQPLWAEENRKKGCKILSSCA